MSVYCSELESRDGGAEMEMEAQAGWLPQGDLYKRYKRQEKNSVFRVPAPSQGKKKKKSLRHLETQGHFP